MIEKIKIENFRCFDSLEVEGFKQFNILVGKNNSGKTALLEGLWISTRPALAIYANNLRNIPYIPKEFVDTLFYNFRSDSSNIKLNNVEISKSTSFNPSTGEDDVSLNFVFESSTFTIQLAKEEKDISIIGDPIKTEFPTRFIPTNSVELKANPLVIELLKNNQIQDILEVLNKIELSTDDINDIVVYGDDLYLKHKTGKSIPLGIFGDGFCRIIQILLHLKLVTNGILFIDEIENGLHYTSQKHLWNAIFTLANKLNVQVFATTHSIDCLKAASEVYSEISELKIQDELRVFNIDKNHKKKVITYTPDELSSVLSNEWDPR